jgi:NAD(P)-dependent dehydrogenase (short-subunit alcohol dehydrogenase family)
MDDEVTLVTGSTSGLGSEVARVLATEGSAVVVTGRSIERGQAVAGEIKRAGGSALFVAADLTDEKACQHLVGSTVDRFGALTVLVNNAVAAGAARDGPVTEVSLHAWHSVLEVNLVSAATLCRLAIPHMIGAGHGSIVNVTSRAAGRGTPGLAAYTASKAGLEALSRSVTIDFARQGIRCNTVQPGYVLHDRRDADLDEERRARIEDMHLTRLSTARDVAHAVLFLASSEAETISGITLAVDGGSTAARGRTLG